MKQLVLLFLLFAIGGCAQTAPLVVNSYESCIQAGGMMLKMYPPRCVYGEKTYRKVLIDEHT
jgi:hypothetical protein